MADLFEVIAAKARYSEHATKSALYHARKLKQWRAEAEHAIANTKGLGSGLANIEVYEPLREGFYELRREAMRYLRQSGHFGASLEAIGKLGAALTAMRETWETAQTARALLRDAIEDDLQRRSDDVSIWGDDDWLRLSA